jgi:hypothetical protein
MPQPSACLPVNAIVIAVVVLALAGPLAACAPKPATKPPVAAITPNRPEAPRSVYRLDFVLATTDASGTTNSAFTMNLEEQQHGSVMVRRNVPIGPPGSSSARQDVGIRVGANFRSVGEDILVQVESETSMSEPPTVRKASTHSVVLAMVNRSSLISVVDDDHRRVQLSVTPTRLR